MSPAGGWRIAAPFLTDTEADQAVRPGGLTAGLAEPSEYQRAILLGLQAKPHVYGYTVDPATIARRRAHNRVARRSRRTNRRGRR